MPGEVPLVCGVSESPWSPLQLSSTSFNKEERKDGAGAAAAGAARDGERRGVEVCGVARPFWTAMAASACSDDDPAFSCGLLRRVRGRLSLRSGSCACGSLGDSVAFLLRLGLVPPRICSCLTLSYVAQALRSASVSCGGGAGASYDGTERPEMLFLKTFPAPCLLAIRIRCSHSRCSRSSCVL